MNNILEGSWGHQSDFYFFAEKVEVGGHLSLSTLTTLDLSTADPEQDVAEEKKGWGAVGWVNLTKTVCLASTSTNLFLLR